MSEVVLATMMESFRPGATWIENSTLGRDDVLRLAGLARSGGVRMLEVTLRTPQALACMEAIARDVPEAVVGAGTVRSKADAQAADECAQ